MQSSTSASNQQPVPRKQLLILLPIRAQGQFVLCLI